MRGIARRTVIKAALGAVTALAGGASALAQSSRMSFPQWVDHFRPRARARGISDATYTRVMGSLKPDTSVYALDRAQPEFQEALWQYINRRVSDWRIRTGKERAREHADLLARIERDYAVDRYIMLGLWGMESVFGDVVTNPKHMRPVLPALAALAWGDPRRRSYWEQELLNALVIIERGWSTPEEMIGSWAGAMGHSQWMPEVWLNMGVDYDHDGRVTPFGKPDDSLAGTAQYMLKRGKYRRGEPWGYEVRLPAGFKGASSSPSGFRSVNAWMARGVTPANGHSFARTDMQARLWRPIGGGPVFLLGQNFFAIRSYNPASSYALAIAHLGDRIRGAGPFVQPFPGGERILTLEELQEIQHRLTALGFDTQGADGRVGSDTMVAVRAFQRKVGLTPADGYPGLKVLAKLRQTS
ncbi:MAG TPA: lytic murein transglycosylase [Xanthobacteraceae bacterium]|jgi:lytic murein transglycosylase|nr:lytic murein transglycosylase [Xanthobacteraceae bacterium]